MSRPEVSRRQFLAHLAGAGSALGLSSGLARQTYGGLANTTAEGATVKNKETNPLMTGKKNIYWGDIHNHNAIGYAKGSLERAYDIARSHLDFFCFTGHSQWHDMPKMPQNKHMKWVRGFEVFKNNWPKVKHLANEYNRSGKFVSFIGYEWHSSQYGDVCIIFPGSKAELVYAKDIRELQDFAAQNGAVLIPHHPAYKQGWRGQNWSVLDTAVSPVVEIFSEHGNAESDRCRFRYIRHSMGGRFTKNTLQWLWQQGVQVGVVASTDDHLGYPGAYGEGLAAVYAEALTRQSVMEAIKARRTYGVSADRVELDFRLNGHWMGETIPFAHHRKIHVKVKGKDVIKCVEVLRNNQAIYRDYPIDRQIQPSSWKRPVLCRIEFGWGPWAALNMARICDWKFQVAVAGGKIISATPCFQSGPFDETRRNKLIVLGEKLCEVCSYTSRTQAYEEKATNSIILEIQGSPQTQVSVTLTKPTKLSITKSLKQLALSGDITFTGEFTSESIMLHRAVFFDNYYTEFEFDHQALHRTPYGAAGQPAPSKAEQTDWYYVRVVQTNESYAWSSPIWVLRPKVRSLPRLGRKIQ
ncbi:MAG: DUF3604 domain-containing protein [Sedimentisphaerales bacterium]